VTELTARRAVVRAVGAILGANHDTGRVKRTARIRPVCAGASGRLSISVASCPSFGHRFRSPLIAELRRFRAGHRASVVPQRRKSAAQCPRALGVRRVARRLLLSRACRAPLPVQQAAPR
jgi:hypothetical protein